MTVYNTQILDDDDGSNPVFGSNVRIDAAATELATSPDQTVATAYLTIKSALSLADVDAELQLTITTTLTADGQITDDGTGTTSATMFFLISDADSDYDNLEADVRYYYDIRVILNDGTVDTLERGRVEWEQGATRATS